MTGGVEFAKENLQKKRQIVNFVGLLETKVKIKYQSYGNNC